MKIDELKELQGRKISVIIRDVPRPVGGVLSSIGDSFIVLDYTSNSIDKAIVSISDIVSIMVNKSNQGEQNERRARERD
jgi:hypothetical protein